MVKNWKLIRVACGLATILAMMVTTSPASARTVAYISNADSAEIYVLELNKEDGSSTVVQKVSVSGTVMPLAISPDRKYLFAALRSEPYSVGGFAIDPKDGMLTPNRTVPLPDSMAYLSTDRTGRWLLAASYGGSKISINAISAAGKVEAVPLAVFPTGKNAHAILTDPSNQFLYVSNLGDDAILQFKFNAKTGEITPNSPPAVSSKKGAGPRHFVFHPQLPLIFGTNELDGTVNTYRRAPTGTLTLVDSTSLIPTDFKGGTPSTADLHLTPDGKFLYTSERTSNTLAAFAVDDAAGKLTLVGHYPTESQPRGFNIDPSGKYLLAVGQKSNRMTTYGIDPMTGALHELSHLEMGKNPNWVEIITLP